MWPELVVAIVDDDSSVRSALTRLIRSCGFRVEPFSSGGEFLRSIDDHEPDCVLLDVNMREINGWEVQSHLSRAKADIPVIVISGEHDPGALARSVGRAKRARTASASRGSRRSQRRGREGRKSPAEREA